MARITNGILGGFSGKVGTVVGASWRGIDYIRGLPEPSNKPATALQLAQRLKMVLFRGFLLGVDQIIENCYQNYEKTTPMNSALSYNMQYAVTGSYPDLNIDFPNLLYSKGDLLSASSLKVVSTETNTIDFTWQNGDFNNYRGAQDQVSLVAYSPEGLKFAKLTDAGVRADEGSRLIFPGKFSGQVVHCYLSFYSKAFSIASTNEYLGAVTVI
ncbi:DUF6266 family protein [Pedobacter ginsengisoli]|uniref:DUF6266 family protein n=1 Tax=Pedobacter ginsengisoli TaxID=363852 RepID=UPI00254B54A4|nr:DUF6266 family protein [Pedobacter ginsengisoli]